MRDASETKKHGKNRFKAQRWLLGRNESQLSLRLNSPMEFPRPITTIGRASRGRQLVFGAMVCVHLPSFLRQIRPMADSIDWTDDTPRRLSVIAKLAFPEGGMTASSLRREAERGRLAIERIAGKDFMSFQAIAEMRKLCRVEQKETPSYPNGAFSVRRSGASWVVDGGTSVTSRLDALRAKIAARRGRI